MTKPSYFVEKMWFSSTGALPKTQYFTKALLYQIVGSSTLNGLYKNVAFDKMLLTSPCL